jgi:hypothetical protein
MLADPDLLCTCPFSYMLEHGEQETHAYFIKIEEGRIC